MQRIIFLLPLIVFLNCKQNPARPTGEVAEKAMVVSAREEASKIGVEIMKKGGNAFDAMVATEMALAVTYPFCLLYTSPSPRDRQKSRMPSSA